MQITIFSDPIYGLGKLPGLPVKNASEAAFYDQDMVKPALLLGDRVTLRTWRLDLMDNELLGAQKARFAVPLVGTIRGVLIRNSVDELAYYEIDKSLRRNLQLVFDLYDNGDGGLDERLIASKAVQEFAKRKIAVHRRNYEALCEPTFRPLIESGVLEELSWDPRSKASWSIPRAIMEFEDAFTVGWESMMETLDHDASGTGVMIDTGIGARLPHEVPNIEYRSTQVLKNAMDLMRLIDGLSTAPLDEVLDLRTELSAYLQPFRQFIFKYATEMDIDPNLPLAERRRQISLMWDAEVAPAIDSLKAEVQSNGFHRNLFRVAADGPEAAIGIGLGLVTATASGALGVTALAGFGVAALPSIIKAASTTIRGRTGARKQGAYFVYEAQKRLARRVTNG
ncbi:hypothetical protein FQ154_16095 [Paeniglutamicibacter gangotriensis]|uniref:Uncharacterized protein n=1 Tax=Paeniglutamicibacter gangotriensis TaxID=254787 RepID=A0A5B0E5M0_9MICC|nr:hypothetical protein [Paeniglutamicibacter gangotriensis]KAA0974163.1 hypothetical protein FQ154_16095 [Paeniglutamicibacter gangotriensis]